MTRAKVVELDACGIRVRPQPDDGDDGSIVLGEYDLTIRSAEQAQALIDAIWRAGREVQWTLFTPEPSKGSPVATAAPALPDAEEVAALLEKATPGPWAIGWASAQERCVETAEGEPIAFIAEWAPDLDKADAALIALAPALARNYVAAERLAKAVEAERAARTTYESTPTDRGGDHGPKGIAHAEWIAARASLGAALAAYNATKGG